MNRRTLMALLALAPLAPMRRSAQDTFDVDSTEAVFERLMSHAQKHQWTALPIGELIGKLGLELRGIPYVAGTLEKDGPESCRIDLTGLDCVTFFEDVLGIARILKKGKRSYNDLVAEITFTRYRNGKLDGYLSRLHYTAEWISDNISKGVVKDVTAEMGGVPLNINVNFMSKHPDFYQPLANNPDMVKEIMVLEKQINAKTRTFIPRDKIAGVEPLMQTGDIVAVATSKAGLDYSHTGLIYRDENNVARMLHASTTQRKVVLDKRISEYIQGVKSHDGITIVRPLPVNT